MTKFSKDDKHLVEFLQKNRPDIPSGSSHLEEQLMNAIRYSEPNFQKNKLGIFFQNIPTLLRSYRRLWLIPPAIAVGLLITWGSHRSLTASKPSPEELASLEVYIESNWDGVGIDNTEESDLEPEWIAPINPHNHPNK